MEKRDWFTSKCALLSLTHPSKICSSNPCGFGFSRTLLQGTSCRVTSKKAVLPNRCVQFRDRRLTTAESPVAYHCIENASATLAFRALMFFCVNPGGGGKGRYVGSSFSLALPSESKMTNPQIYHLFIFLENYGNSSIFQPT